MSKKQSRILSGNASKTLWRDINKLRDHSPEAHMAIYHLACKCQELEVMIEDLQNRITVLEQKVKW